MSNIKLYLTIKQKIIYVLYSAVVACNVIINDSISSTSLRR